MEVPVTVRVQAAAFDTAAEAAVPTVPSPPQTPRRWPLQGLVAIHRFGRIAPGEPIVLVVTASAHRAAAFAAAEFLMDFMKTRAPFWKKEHHPDGSSGDWVDAKEADDAATARWTP